MQYSDHYQISTCLIDQAVKLTPMWHVGQPKYEAKVSRYLEVYNSFPGVVRG